MNICPTILDGVVVVVVERSTITRAVSGCMQSADFDSPCDVPGWRSRQMYLYIYGGRHQLCVCVCGVGGDLYMRT